MGEPNDHWIREFLEEKVDLYNRPSFIGGDPISVPHRFSEPGDIEVSGLFSAVFAWGKRQGSIRKANELMRRMDDAPHDFILHFSDADLAPLEGFVHRTFNAVDARSFCLGLKRIYHAYGSLETAFRDPSGKPCPSAFRERLLKGEFAERSLRHVPDILRGSAAKRLRMFLRWMVRDDRAGVDFGIWKSCSPADLYIPLDVHSGNVARKLGLLSRRQNDHKAVLELSDRLRAFDPADPVKYDFALFGLGIFEGF